MRTIVPFLVSLSLLVVAMEACTTENASTSTRECSDDTACDSDEVCSKGKCVAYDGGGSGGSTSTSTSSTTGSGVAPSPKQACQDYLDCLAVVSPGQVAPALPVYGSEGSCWTADQQTADTCETACREAMKDYHGSAPAECLECYVDSDCDAGATCESGDCVVPPLPLPDPSAECGACRDVAVADPCAFNAEQCASDPDCVAVAMCVGACNGDLGCVSVCADGPGAEPYFYGYMSCVVCEYCGEVCNAATWCQFFG